MAEYIFVDTSAFIGLKCQKDQNFESAYDFYNVLLTDKKFNLITSNFIVHETATMLKARLENKHAIEFSRYLRGSDFIKIIKITDHLEMQAWQIFDRYDDKDFSFIDCSSFAVMKELGITKAFTFDDHFKQFGFEIVPLL